MTTRKLLIIALSIFALSACEKLDTTSHADEKKSGHKTQTEEGSKHTDNEEDESIDAYSVDYVLEDLADEIYQYADITPRNIWVYGYIVGYIDGTSMNKAVFKAGDIQTNILLAENPFEKNAEKCLPIQLSTSSAKNRTVREDLNLADNPDRLGQIVCICGDLTMYMGTTGLKNTTGYYELEDNFDYEAYYKSLEEKEDNPEITETEDTLNISDGKDTGTQELIDSLNSLDVFSVADVIGPITRYFSDIPTTMRKVKGYIVGYVAQNKNSIKSTIFYQVNEDVDLRPRSNIVIADSPNERDTAQCIAVQLSEKSNKEVFEQLNIKDNPGNFERQVVVTGNIAQYMKKMGVIDTNAFYWEQEK
jgi:hypothetical protein